MLRVATAAVVAAASIGFLKFREQRQIKDRASEWEAKGVVIPRPRQFFSRLAAMIAAGPSGVQVISDYDRTMTVCYKTSVDGDKKEKGATSHGVMEQSPLLPSEYKAKAAELVEIYYPLEVAENLSHAQREKYMIEWWSKAHELLLSYRVNQSFVEESVRDAKLELRSGCHAFVSKTKELGIPLLVFSAGLGDVVSVHLRDEQLMFPNVHLVSNLMNFDKDGWLVGFGPLIHAMNKDYSAVMGSAFVSGTSDRAHVILLGDNIHDSRMTHGMPNEKDANVIKIGFLNDNIESRMEQYCSAFDAVVLHDGNFDLPCELLSAIGTGKLK